MGCHVVRKKETNAVKRLKCLTKTIDSYDFEETEDKRLKSELFLAIFKVKEQNLILTLYFCVFLR